MLPTYDNLVLFQNDMRFSQKKKTIILIDL